MSRRNGPFYSFSIFFAWGVSQESQDSLVGAGRKPVVGDIKKVEVTKSTKCNQKLSETRSEIYPLDFLTRRLLTTLERTSSLDIEIEDS